MAEGKVKTLYSDKDKTEALFPRTKTSAVSNDEGVGLDALMEGLLYSGVEDGEESTVPTDADTLGGLPAKDYATQNYVRNEIANAQLNGGEGSDIDLSGFVTQDDFTLATNSLQTQLDSAYKLNYRGESIPESSDLNDYVTPGIYSATYATSVTLTNSPFTSGMGFKLVVEIGYGGARYIQTIYPGVTNSNVYKRFHEDGVWGDWKKEIYSLSDLGVADLASGMVMICNSNGKIATSSVVSTAELGYLDGVTSAIQTQLDGKAKSSHTHTLANISNINRIATSSAKALSTAGWYRIAKRSNTSANASKFASAFLCDILLYTSYSNSNNEIHEVKFNASYSKYGFSSILDRTNTTGGLITQIRYTIASDNTGYIEVYYSGSSENTLYVAIDNNFQASPFEAIEPEATTAAPTGVTIAATHSLPKNSHPLASVLTADDYGTSLPSTATAGRIFFKKVT